MRSWALAVVALVGCVLVVVFGGGRPLAPEVGDDPLATHTTR
ncbi:hypothetical protein [Saccharopolyspora taberi]